MRGTLVRGPLAAIADTRKLIASDAPLQQPAGQPAETRPRRQAMRHLADTLDRHPRALLRGKPEET